MTKHARYSPSKLEALEKCPCFESDNAMRTEKDLGAATEGTMLHDAMENDNPSNLESEEQMWAYNLCQDYITKLIESCRGRFDDRREIKSTVRGLTYGFADRVIIDYASKTIHVADYKFGRVAVDHAEHNLQLRAYGVGLFERFTSFKHLHLHLIAPRIPDFTDAVFGRDVIDVTRDRIKNIISSTADVFKKPSGGEHCSFCTNKPRCEVMNRAVEGVVRGAGFLPLPEKFLPESIVSAEDRSKSLLLARILPDWCKLVKQMNTSAVLEYGDEIPGFSLRRRAGSVSVSDAQAVLGIVTSRMGFTHEQLLVSGVASVSISKLADLIRTEHPVEEFDTKRDYVDALVEMLGDAVSRGSEVIFLQKDRKPTDEELMKQLT
jgi:hypothetical protein